MGLLVGLWCQDGVVIGSDSSRPGDAADPPAMHRPLKKVSVIGGDVVAATTGSVGLGQRFARVLGDLREDSRFHEWQHAAIARSIASEARREFDATHGDLAGFGALVGFLCVTGFHLCEFTAGQLQPEFKGPDAWFAAMGPGRATAESLLALVGRAVFGGRRPAIEEGVLAVVWALDHAMQLHPGRVQGPMQIAVLAGHAVDTSRAARLLAPDELAEQVRRVRRAEVALADVLRQQDP